MTKTQKQSPLVEGRLSAVKKIQLLLDQERIPQNEIAHYQQYLENFCLQLLEGVECSIG